MSPVSCTVPGVSLLSLFRRFTIRRESRDGCPPPSGLQRCLRCPVPCREGCALQPEWFPWRRRRTRPPRSSRCPLSDIRQRAGLGPEMDRVRRGLSGCRARFSGKDADGNHLGTCRAWSPRRKRADAGRSRRLVFLYSPWMAPAIWPAENGLTPGVVGDLVSIAAPRGHTRGGPPKTGRNPGERGRQRRRPVTHFTLRCEAGENVADSEARRLGSASRLNDRAHAGRHS